jgi:glyoxylase-like metal-dependent hydrolase (beta-lactamase superfamily II)
MRDCVGRTDLLGGDGSKLIASVRKPMELPRDVAVCGSHGPRTTLDAEFSTGAYIGRVLQ